MSPPVSSPAVKVVKSVREQVSAEEWQARVDLAACYRLTAIYGMTEMVANHISCRVPGTTDQFLIAAPVHFRYRHRTGRHAGHFTIVPAGGIYTFLNISPDEFANLAPVMTTDQIVRLDALRSGEHTLVAEFARLVNFPSFHAAWAVLFMSGF